MYGAKLVQFLKKVLSMLLMPFSKVSKMMARFSRVQVMCISGLMVMVVAGAVLGYFLFVKENFSMSMEDDVQHPEEVGTAPVPERLMWNMSNITKNASYDARGETMEIPKTPVSNTHVSSYEHNMTNERVM